MVVESQQYAVPGIADGAQPCGEPCRLVLQSGEGEGPFEIELAVEEPVGQPLGMCAAPLEKQRQKIGGLPLVRLCWRLTDG